MEVEEILEEVNRGKRWAKLLGVPEVLSSNKSLFAKLLAMKQVPQEEVVGRDIERTFSRHLFFADRTGPGQRELFQLLRAYAAYDLEVGYCQGMGFVAAVLLCHMQLEEAFWSLVTLMQRPEYEMRQLFRPGMPKFRHAMHRLVSLMERLTPKVSKHFATVGIEPAMFASQWFMTLFAYNFPLRFVSKVWDLFIKHGWSFVYRVAIALIQLASEMLVNLSFEDIMAFFRDMPTKLSSVDQQTEVISQALSLPIPPLGTSTPL